MYLTCNVVSNLLRQAKIKEGGGAVSTIFCDVKLDGASLVHNTAALGLMGVAAAELCLRQWIRLEASQNAPLPTTALGDLVVQSRDACESVNLSNGTRFVVTLRSLTAAPSAPQPTNPTLSSSSMFRETRREQATAAP